MITTFTRRAASALVGTAVVLSLAAVAGCAAVAPTPQRRRVDDDGHGVPAPHSPRTPGPQPPTTPIPTDQPVQSGTPMDEDVNGAVDVVDTYWEQHWSETFEDSYEAPQVYGFYNGTSGPACGAQPSEPDNAYYCPEGDYVAWDTEFMAQGYETGDTFVVVIVAHEWAHAIQNRLDPSLVSEARELQADCFAGAVLEGASEDGTFTVETGDTQEILVAFDELGDDQPWVDSTSHGTPQQRLDAFEQGVDNGVAGCLPTP
jgi:predicted metalloprotease